MEVKLAVHYKQERINPEDNNNGLLWGFIITTYLK